MADGRCTRTADEIRDALDPLNERQRKINHVSCKLFFERLRDPSCKASKICRLSCLGPLITTKSLSWGWVSSSLALTPLTSKHFLHILYFFVSPLSRLIVLAEPRLSAMAGVAPFNVVDDCDRKVFPFVAKVMFSFLLFLLAVLLFIGCITVNAICLKRRRLRMPRRQLAASGDEDPVRVQRLRLQKSVIEGFPVFVYRSEDFVDGGLECAVCLSDFEENDKGRTLPECKHNFHAECIDKWFEKQSICPLCRAAVHADPQASAMDHDASCQQIDVQMQ